MALYRYVKTYPKLKRRHPPFFSFVFMIAGTGLLIWVGWPIVSFILFTQGLFASIVSPLQITSESIPSRAVLAAAGDQAVGETRADYTNANAWFPAQPQKKVSSPISTYRISIPKLKILKAKVIIAGDDLSTSLIHYGGTPLPGEYGNTVIFGHSTLTQFYNPNDYKSIFSLLPTLKVGNDIFLYYDGITYHYRVSEMEVKEATDLSSLEQRFDASRLTLITCVPPGTYWKRLNVKAELQRL